MPILNVLHTKSLRSDSLKPNEKNVDNSATSPESIQMQRANNKCNGQVRPDEKLSGKETCVLSNKRSVASASNQQHTSTVSKYSDFLKSAAKMEQARRALLAKILNTPGMLTVFAEKCLYILEQNDLSEILTVKMDAKTAVSESDSSSVQPGRFKEIETDLKTLFNLILANHGKVEDSQVKFVSDFHFLPSLLHQVAKTILDEGEIAQNDKACIEHYQGELMQSRCKMVEGNIRLVTYVAKQFKYTKLAFSDLLQEGTVGLIKAVDRFDYQREVRFSTYAIYWIKQTISRFIVKQEKTVRLPFSIATKAALVFDTMHDRLQLTNRWPSAYELSQLCNISENEIIAILKYYQPGVSLFSTVNSDQDMPELIDTLEQTHFPLPLEEMSQQNLSHTIDQAIKSLPEREADVICARFGIHNCVEMTLQEIADHLHISRERVRQIQNNAIQKLKKTYGLQLEDFLTPGSV